MKKLRKVFAIVLVLSMIFACSITAQAATIINHNQDTSVLSLSISAASEVLYTASTVEGGDDYPDVTTYSYYAKFPANFGSLKSVSVTAVYPKAYRLRLDGSNKSYTTSGNYRTSTFKVNFNKSHVLEIRQGSNTVRKFQFAGGIIGATLDPVCIGINVHDAVTWVNENGNMDSQSQAALDYILNLQEMNANGEMATAVISNVPAGSTAMDILYYLCYGKGTSNVSIMCGDTNITANGLGLGINGTGNPITYVSGIGIDSTSSYLSEFSTESTSGWLYEDQNGFPNYGAADYYLTGGESFIWRFVNNFMDYYEMF